MRPALSLRAALADVRRRSPGRLHEHTEPLGTDDVAADFATRHAGVPATGRTAPEDVVVHRQVTGHRHPVLLGLYGDERRVRAWLPGLPERTDPRVAARLLAAARPPQQVADPPCACLDATGEGLGALPVLQTTPRDAGPYLTMGLLCAPAADGGRPVLSVHRMLVLDDKRLTVWMVPGRRLRALYEETVARGERLPVTVNIGVPPAVMIASALNARFLPAHLGKLDVAGALAGAPVTLGRPASGTSAVTLAESEIVVEGHLDGTTAPESLAGPPRGSLPEFLGYDGSARPDLPVLTVTAITTREAPLYQACIGPGREQSVILGLAGALSVALSLSDGAGPHLVHDLHFSPAGGGMLLLTVAVRKRSPADDDALGPLARRILTAHPFVKLVVFTDDDIDVAAAEDVLWAMTTRANLGTDAITLDGFRPLGMDLSQGEAWTAERGPGGSGRTWIDATAPFRLRDLVRRSY
ncbi:UbiD family decarboxylase [Streptomyces sp. NPDC051172]|uniref:UbiD family decarboxylase n=1 Tax=Streptomyces sp. NPDC051172 TaxID=3155796 RepID=UPI00341DDDD9